MAEIASAYVSLLPSAKGFGSKLNGQIGGDVDKAGRTSGTRFGKVFATASMSPIRAIGVAAVGLFAVKEVKDFFSSSIGEAREAQKVGALTAQVIKTTGGAAKISAAQIGDLATAISLKTGIDDEAIQTGANMLLTFTNVRNEVGKGNKVFNQATRLATDMSAALGGDAKSAALQLGKALNDPTKGVTKLARSGVSFTEQQVAQIKAMQASGNVLGAQKIILGEVSKEFGGAAAAQATAGEKMSVAWGNLKEQIGTALLPVLDKLEGAITTKVIPAVSRFVDWAGPALSKFGSVLTPIAGKIGAFVSDVSKAFGFLFDRGSLGDRADGFAEVFDHALGNTGKLVGPLREVGSVILQIVAGFSRMIDTFQGGKALNGGIVGFFEQVGVFGRQAVGTIKTFATQAIAIFQGQVLPILRQGADTFRNVILPALSALVSYVATSVWPVLMQFVGIIRDNLIPIIASFASFVYGTLYPAIVRIVTVVAMNLKPVFDQLVATFRANVLPALQQILARFQQWQPTIQRVASVVLMLVGHVLEFAAAVLGHVLPVAIRFAGFLLSKLVPAILNTIEFVARFIGAVIRIGAAFVGAIANVAKFYIAVYKKIGQVLKVVAEIPGKVVSALGDLSTTLYHSGIALLAGFGQGIADKARDVYNAAKDALSKVKNLFPHSPAKEGPFSGRGWVLYSGHSISEALAKGISDKAPKAVKATFHLVSKIKSAIDTLKDAFGQLSSSIASSFTSGLFDITAAVTQNGGAFSSAVSSAGASLGQQFVASLTAKKGQLQALNAAFKKLVGEGLSPTFLSGLMQSGNADLILSLASGPASTARESARLYGDIQGLATQLSNGVATDVYGPQIVRKLHDLEKAIDRLPHGLGGIINGAAKKGKKKSR